MVSDSSTSEGTWNLGEAVEDERSDHDRVGRLD